MTDERIARLQEIGFEWSRGHSSTPPAYLRMHNQNETNVSMNDVSMNDVSMNDVSMNETNGVSMVDKHTMDVTSNEEEMKIEQIVEEQVQQQFSCTNNNVTNRV